MAFESQLKKSSKATRTKKTLVLCFDGTGNKFSGTPGDSNVLKIFGCLDREDSDQHHYYQPGIGTYTSDGSLSHTSHYQRIRSWYQKSKDAAIGTGFENHVMGGYKFLMRYYQPGDDIYFFGFSRGAYTARFLAQMLDYIGLLAPGNEELLRFAWKTFAKWQQCTDVTPEDWAQKEETYQFMKKFRGTFSVPVKRLRFLGLFDTVNSVSAFEGAFLTRRNKFPYTATSSAKIVRHAVSIDERRAKFRQDLLGQKPPSEHHHRHRIHDYYNLIHDALEGEDHVYTEDKPSKLKPEDPPKPKKIPTGEANRFKPRGSNQNQHLAPPIISDAASSAASVNLTTGNDIVDEDHDGVDDNAVQDIQEVWFPGCHADIGGGWPLEHGEEIPLSHVPLMWMIREAHKAGLPFNKDALLEANYILEDSVDLEVKRPGLRTQASELGFHDAREVQTPGPDEFPDHTNPAVPVLEIDGTVAPEGDVNGPAKAPKGEVSVEKSRRQQYLDAHAKGSTQGRIHDVLQRDNGVPASSVLSWNVMEWLPFRRMDLKADGTWKAIRFPLPRGETRDMPADAWVHASAIRRMEADRNYRPGNLIVGGGGRGMRRAPPEVGMGKWKVMKERGDPVGEVLVRDIEAGNIEKLKQAEMERREAKKKAKNAEKQNGASN